MDWGKAESHLYEIKNAYVEIGYAGCFALSLIINPLVKRYEEGERTTELYNEIMGLEW